MDPEFSFWLPLMESPALWVKLFWLSGCPELAAL